LQFKRKKIIRKSFTLMLASTLFLLWLVLLILLLGLGLFLNLLGLAGNWLILGSMIAHAFIADPFTRPGISWPVIALLAALAVLGEGLEFLAGLLGAGKAGASRRALILSFVGSMIGAGFGFTVGNAVAPIIGGIAGVFLLGATGALVGAVLGETWKGKTFQDSMASGKGAFIGRLVGTLSKTFVGTTMLMISIGALLF
jgi:uncharacterized protein YqgC (DUF456 family)